MREARFALSMWFVAGLWTVTYCYLRGYNSHEPDDWLVRHGLARVRTPENLDTFLGVPDWVCFGVLIPWVICVSISVVYGLLIMGDDDVEVQQ